MTKDSGLTRAEFDEWLAKYHAAGGVRATPERVNEYFAHVHGLPIGQARRGLAFKLKSDTRERINVPRKHALSGALLHSTSDDECDKNAQ